MGHDEFCYLCYLYVICLCYSLCSGPSESLIHLVRCENDVFFLLVFYIFRLFSSHATKKWLTCHKCSEIRCRCMLISSSYRLAVLSSPAGLCCPRGGARPSRLPWLHVHRSGHHLRACRTSGGQKRLHHPDPHSHHAQ